MHFFGRRQENIDTGIADAVAAAHVKMQHGKKMMDKLLLLLRWVKTYGDIAWRYAEDLTVFVRRRNCFHPYRFWKLVDISPQDCYSWFGATNNNLERLFVHWRVPATFTATSCHLYGGEECFIIFLYHMMKGVLFTDIAHHTFGGDPWNFSAMNVLMINHLYMMFCHKI